MSYDPIPSRYALHLFANTFHYTAGGGWLFHPLRRDHIGPQGSLDNLRLPGTEENKLRQAWMETQTVRDHELTDVAAAAGFLVRRYKHRDGACAYRLFRKPQPPRVTEYGDLMWWYDFSNTEEHTARQRLMQYLLMAQLKGAAREAVFAKHPRLEANPDRYRVSFRAIVRMVA
jgi:hypothetical protein